MHHTWADLHVMSTYTNVILHVMSTYTNVILHVMSTCLSWRIANGVLLMALVRAVWQQCAQRHNVPYMGAW